MIGLAASTRSIELVGADVDQRRGMAVIGVIDDDEVVAASVCRGQAYGQFVRLAAAIDKETDRKWIGQGRGERLGVVQYRRVQIAGIGI